MSRTSQLEKLACATVSLDTSKTRRMLERTMEIRKRLQESLESLSLFGAEKTQHTRGQHPQMQILLRLRDEMEALTLMQGRMQDAGMEIGEEVLAVSNLRVRTLVQMGKVTESITNEVGRAGVEMAGLAKVAAEMNQRKLEHEDHMEVERMKIRGLSTNTTARDILNLVADRSTDGADDAGT